MAIDFTRSNIPSPPSEDNNLIEGGKESTQVGSDPELGCGPNSSTDLGMGPQGNMFGVQSHADAVRAMDEAYNYAGPAAYVDKKDGFMPIEEVEGFGEPDQGKMATPLLTNRGS